LGLSWEAWCSKRTATKYKKQQCSKSFGLSILAIWEGIWGPPWLILGRPKWIPKIQKMVPEIVPNFTKFMISFMIIFWSIVGPEFAPKGDGKWETSFGTLFRQLSNAKPGTKREL